MGLFGTYSERQVKKINKIAKSVDALSEKYKNMTSKIFYDYMEMINNPGQMTTKL